MLLILALFASSVVAELEEAPYTVVKEHDGWEERAYPPTMWVSSEGWDVLVHDGPQHQSVFYKLFNYIDGGNDANMKIPMTAPVTYRILPGEGANCESNYTMSFLIPADLQMAPPAPNNPEVYIEERPELHVAVKTFGGFPTELTWTMEASDLYDLATEAGLNPGTVPLWTASYDGPSVIVNRRNDVWLEV